MTDRTKLALAAVLAIAAAVLIAFSELGFVALGMASAAAYLFYDSVSSMRVLARRRARARARIPAARVVR